MQKQLFEADTVARVGWSGWIESGIDGVVYVEDMHVRYVPIMASSGVATSWPAQMRERLSHELIQDKQTHFFIVCKTETSFDICKLRRDDAERILRSGEFARQAQAQASPPAEAPPAAAEAPPPTPHATEAPPPTPHAAEAPPPTPLSEIHSDNGVLRNNNGARALNEGPL